MISTPAKNGILTFFCFLTNPFVVLVVILDAVLDISVERMENCVLAFS